MILGDGQRGDPNGVVHIASAGDVSALAVSGTGAVYAGITDVRLWIDAGPEDPQNGPHDALRALSRGAVPEREAQIEVVELPPSDCEEDGLAGIDPEPSIPARVVRLPHPELLAGKPSPVLLDETDDGLGGRKEDLPGLTPVLVR